MPVLELRHLLAGHDGVAVVHDVSLTVYPGEVVVLLGANGAGKSTTLLTASGLLPVLGGEVLVEGEVVGSSTRRRSMGRAAALARSGLVHVPEDRGLFSDLTVREHLRLTRRSDRSPSETVVFEQFPALERIQDRRAGLLSGGEQQQLALARAVIAGPRVLLVDELSLGLAPLVVQSLLPLLRDLVTERGIGVLLVEQHVRLALEVADRAALMRRGEIVLSGTAEELGDQLEAIEAGYLGDELPA
ncbi:MAG: ATP-binding cassette domain-containing protein [Actinobacteria bacterium]|nr:ATP-binding cassette domain-containing protein [Actinomycetota bacterium]